MHNGSQSGASKHHGVVKGYLQSKLSLQAKGQESQVGDLERLRKKQGPGRGVSVAKELNILDMQFPELSGNDAAAAANHRAEHGGNSDAKSRKAQADANECCVVQ